MLPNIVEPDFPIQFIAIPRTNYYKGRDRWIPDMIVIHATEGLRKSVIDTFTNSLNKVSTHFLVCQDGSILQFVSTGDTAYGNGVLINPTSPTVLQRNRLQDSNPNLYTISIEHELLKGQVPTDVQYMASAKLISFLHRKWQITIDSVHIIPHNSIDGNKTCPDGVQISKLISLAHAIQGNICQ